MVYDQVADTEYLQCTTTPRHANDPRLGIVGHTQTTPITHNTIVGHMTPMCMLYTTARVRTGHRT